MIDIYRMKPEQIQADIKENYQFGMFFYIMKSIHEEDIFKAMKRAESELKSIGHEPHDLHFYLSVVYYVLTEAKNTANKDKLIKLFTNCVRKQNQGEVMTIADQLREEGIEQRTEFIINNMLKKNLEIPEIASMTGLRVSEIKKFLGKKKR